MDFRILGPLEVLESGKPVRLGAGKQRLLLALFLLHPNELLYGDGLVDALWGERPPPTAGKMLHNYVWHLRRALSVAGPAPSRLETHGNGYLLRVAPGERDADRFERGLDEARARGSADPEGRSRVLREALSLWRGPPLSDFTYQDFAHEEIGRLEELRLGALEELFDAELALGWHGGIVAQLTRLVHEHPLRERLLGQLMLALYRSSRQAEALEAYQTARRALVEERGLDPSTPLQKLQQAILRQDPDLGTPTPADPARHPRPRRRLPAAAMSTSSATPGFVGREGERQALVEALLGIDAGRSCGVLVRGEAGVGKTRLLAEAREGLREADIRVLTGECISLGEGAIPFLPIVATLRELSGQEGPAHGQAAAAIAALVSGPEPGSGRLRQFDVVLSALRSAADESPVVLALEDIHWADGATLDLLAYVLRALPDDRLGLVLTFRGEELAMRPALRSFLTGVARLPAVTRIDLERLGPDAAARLVRGIAGDPLTAADVDAVLRRAEGNPFFLVELAATLSGPRTDGELPPTVHDLLEVRLGALDTIGRRVAGAAAVAGRAVDHRVLAQSAGLSSSELDDGVSDCILKAVFEPSSAAGRVHFRHALLRETAYKGVMPGERVQLHAAYGRTLEARGAEPGEIAQHWFLADDDDRALAWAVRAATAAERVHAPVEAHLHLKRALELWPRTPESELIAGTDRCDLLRRAAESAAAIGRYDQAIRLIDEGIALIDVAAQPLLAGRLLERRAWYTWAAGEVGAAVAAYQEVLELLPATPPNAERAWALAGYAYALMMSSRHADAGERAREAIATARAVGAARAEALALTPLGVARSRAGDVEGGLDDMRRSADFARRHGWADDAVHAAINLTNELDSDGRLDEAAELALSWAKEAAIIGRERQLGSMLENNAAESLFSLGRWSEADALTAKALERGPDGVVASALRITRASVLASLGRLTEAEMSAADAIRSLGDDPPPDFRASAAIVRMEIDLWRDRIGEPTAAAESGLAAALETADPTTVAMMGWIAAWAYADFARSAQSGHEQDGALTASRAAEAVAAIGSPPDAEARAYAAMAGAEALRASGGPSAGAWAAAAAAWPLGREPHRVAYARWREAEARLDAGEPRAQAAVPLRAANATAVELGAALLVERTARLAQRWGIELGQVDASGMGPAGAEQQLGLASL